MRSEPIVVRLREPGDLPEFVPHLLGFHPTESIVAVALQGPRERAFFSLRVDLAPESDDAFVAQTVADRIAAAKPDGVLVFVFTAEAPVGSVLPRRHLVDEVVERCEVPVREALLVGPDRVWSYRCEDPVCCPPEGRPRTRDSGGALALAAAGALTGRAVLPSREDVVAGVAAVGGVTAVSMRQAAIRAWLRWHADPDDVLAAAAAVLDAAIDGGDDAAVDLTHDDAATLVVALHEVGFRDAMIGRWRREVERDALRATARQVARLAQPPFDAPACTVFAWLSYLAGEGLVATCALDRAFGTDPDYRLAGLLDVAVDGQLPPAVLAEALTNLPG